MCVFMFIPAMLLYLVCRALVGGFWERKMLGVALLAGAARAVVVLPTQVQFTVGEMLLMMLCAVGLALVGGRLVGERRWGPCQICQSQVLTPVRAESDLLCGDNCYAEWLDRHQELYPAVHAAYFRIRTQLEDLSRVGTALLVLGPMIALLMSQFWAVGLIPLGLLCFVLWGVSRRLLLQRSLARLRSQPPVARRTEDTPAPADVADGWTEG